MRKHSYTFGWFICGLGALFYCYEYLLRISPGVMAPQLIQAFNIDATALGALSAFYYFAYVPMQLPVGVLVDYFGPKKLIILAVSVCALGALLFTSSHLWVAKTGRFITGFGSAFAFIGVLKLATIWLPKSQFALATGLAITVSMLGVVGGDVILSKLVHMCGWPAVMYLLGGLGILLAVIIWLVVPDKNTDNDAVGLSYNLKQLCQDIINLIKKPKLWLIGIVGCVLYLPVTMFAELWAVPFLNRVQGLPNFESAKIVSALFLGLAIGSPLAGIISDACKKIILPMTIFAILTLLTTILLLYLPKVASFKLYIIFFLLGLFTSGQNLVFTFARAITGLSVAGTAIAIVNMLVMLSGLIAQPLAGFLLDFISNNKITGQLGVYSSQVFHQVMFILPGSIFIGILLLLVMKDPKDL